MVAARSPAAHRAPGFRIVAAARAERDGGLDPAAGGGRVTAAAIETRGVSKRFGRVQAVSDLSFEAHAGRVTGFLGPNGAGKSTTLRMLLGLIGTDGGDASFGGRRYTELEHASRHVGAVLENASFHPGRTGRNHLRVLAAAGEHPAARVGEVLDQVGLADAADRRVKGYSMGMRQRLAIAAALLGDPEVLILDEPTNGLDPPGIRWMRDLVRYEAGRGRAVLISSHLLSEVAQSVDDVVVISRGRLRGSGTLAAVLGGDEPVTRVRARDGDRLAALLRERGAAVEAGDALIVRGARPEEVGEIAAEHRVALSELGVVSRSLEEAFFALTGEEA
jgi:ABC-2 type transport system ATP-binding protein